MRRLVVVLELLLCLLFPVSAVRGHYTMLLPKTPSAKKGVAVTLVYQWGHPFEHQLFDTAPAARLVVFSPDGKEQELTSALEQVKAVAGGGKAVTAFRLRFTPEQRGDYTFVLSTPPIWKEEDQEFVQDNVQVVLHVQAQRAWDANTGQRFKLVPITRPYGLLPGTVFQAQLQGPPLRAVPGPGGPSWPLRTLPGMLIEIEHYNAQPPRRLPPDEQITRTCKTDPSGVLTCTLPEAGWWGITAQRPGPVQLRDGKRYPMKERATLWVYVDKAPPPDPAK
jgi:cobalt/nickel transport protein